MRLIMFALWILAFGFAIASTAFAYTYLFTLTESFGWAAILSVCIGLLVGIAASWATGEVKA